MKFLTVPEKETFKTQSVRLTDKDCTCESDEKEILPNNENPVIEISAETKKPLELNPDSDVQYRDNYKIARRSLASISLMGAISGGIGALIHRCITYGLNDLMTGVILIFIVIAVRLFVVHRQAVALTKSKYVLTESDLIASGPADRNDWKLPVSEIEKAVLLGRSRGRHDLVIKTAKSTQVLAGLSEPEKLLQILPAEIQADCSQLEHELKLIAESVRNCKDADELEKVRNLDTFKLHVADSLKSFPEALVLTQKKNAHTNDLIGLSIILLLSILACHFGFSKYALPVIGISIQTSFMAIKAYAEASERVFIISPDALFELDRKNAEVIAISLDRVRIEAGDSPEDGAIIRVDGGVKLSFKCDREVLEVTKNYVNSYPKPKE